ncbi:MAG: D-Ala-D-Ala carboxypeptidase family metallohydrolase [Candidatus Eiseniibacteriota bacterium]
MTRAEFTEAVFTYCCLTGASATSAERSERHNAAMGGVEHSAHLVGLARDVVYADQPPLEYRRAWALRLGLLLIHEGDHDHLQPLDWRAG